VLKLDVKVDYDKYIQSKDWAAKSHEVKVQQGWRCYDCHKKTRTLEAHHLTYSDLGVERQGQLVALCPDCHSKRHGYKKRYDIDDMLDMPEDAL